MTFPVYVRRTLIPVLEGDKVIQTIGYNMIRADHPSNAKRDGVCIFYKKALGARVVNLTNLSECVFCEVSIQNNIAILVLYIDLQAKKLLIFRIFSQDLKEF